MYGLTIEAFKYNGELIRTGVDVIDSIPNIQAVTVNHTVQANGTGSYTELEWAYQGSSLANSTAKGVVAKWDKPNLNLELRNIKGEFTNNQIIIGETSNARWTFVSADPMQNANDENMQDNFRIETEADNIIDFSEVNPFGEP